MWKLFVPLLVIAAAIWASVSSDTASPKTDLTFVNRGDVTSLDLQTISWMQDLRVARIAFEGLVRPDIFSREYTPAPAVAERWTISQSGTHYTFYLRANAKWSNGQRVLPSHFVYAWRRALLPETGSDYIAQFQFLKGGAEFTRWRAQALNAHALKVRNGRIKLENAGPAAQNLWEETCRKFDELVDVRADDAKGTLDVELERPCSYFLDLCGFPQLYPVYPPLLDRFMLIDGATGSTKIDQSWCKSESIISNGPFKLVLWRFKRDMQFEQNPYWWNLNTLNIRTISVPTIDDANGQVLAFRSGAVDWMSDVDVSYRGEMLRQKSAFYREHAEVIAALRAKGIDEIEIDRTLPSDPRNKIIVTPAFGTYYYNFNCREKLPDGRENPMRDPRVRRAFALAADKRTIVESVRRSGEPIRSTMVPPDSIRGYQSPKGLECDPDQARKELAAAGFPGGNGFPTIEILFNNEGGHDFIAQALARNWERELGVHIELAQREIKVFRDDLKNGNFMIARGSWFGDYGDPTTFLNIYRTEDGNNDARYASSEYEGLMTRAEMESDPARRLSLLTQAEAVLIEKDFPCLPLFGYLNFYMFDPHRLTGISSHPRSEQHLWEVDILGDGQGKDQIIRMKSMETVLKGGH